MARGVKRVVGAAALRLRVVELVADRVIVRRGAEPTFELLERRAGSDARQSDRFAVALSQFIGGTKIIFTGVIFGDTEPGIRQPIRMLRGGASKLRGIAALRPKREERKLLGFAE